MRPARQGQTLVMMALTGLLTTLMVMMTISIGSKVKEKMEVQMAADTGAYSQAIATARAYNAVSLMNRVGVAHVTGALAIQSLVSWATFYHSTLYRSRNTNLAFFRNQYQAWIALCCIPFSPCSAACACARAGRTAVNLERTMIALENALFTPYFASLDTLAALELLAVLSSVDWLHLLGQLPVLWNLGNFLDDQDGVDRLTNSLRGGTRYNELVVDGSPNNVNEFETGVPTGFALPPKGALMALNPIYNHHAFAAMGTRLHPFITGRTTLLGGDASVLITMRLLLLRSNPALLFQALVPGITMGSGYLARPPGIHHGVAVPITTWFSRNMTADDHGVLVSFWNTFAFPSCPIFPIIASTPRAHIWSSATNGQHRGDNWFDANHILGVGVGGLRSYPWFFDYNMLQVNRPGNIWGQPKNFSVVKRDLTRRPNNGIDQWNPLFRFTYTGTQLYDQTGTQTKDGTSIARQTALGTGITYYHRGNNFFGYHSGVEPPNFFNPYWRGGLTHINVDNSGLNDFSSGVSGYPAAVDSFNGLRANGFLGWQ